MKDVEVRRTVLLVASMWKAIKATAVHAVNRLVGQLGRLCSAEETGAVGHTVSRNRRTQHRQDMLVLRERF